MILLAYISASMGISFMCIVAPFIAKEVNEISTENQYFEKVIT